MKLILTFCTRYNGVSIYPKDYDNVEYTDELNRVFDEVADTLPGFTYEWANNWEHTLSKEHIQRLCEMAADIVRPVVSNPEIEFEYDHYSS